LTAPSSPGPIADALGRLLGQAKPRGVVAVYLFGSHAEHRAHRQSDVDVAVLLDPHVYAGAEARFQERVRLSAWLVGELKTNLVDVVILNDAPPTLARRIVTTGRRVYCVDLDAAHAFVRDVQLRAADLEPFLRRTRRLKLASIAR